MSSRSETSVELVPKVVRVSASNSLDSLYFLTASVKDALSECKRMGLDHIQVYRIRKGNETEEEMYTKGMQEAKNKRIKRFIKYSLTKTIYLGRKPRTYDLPQVRNTVHIRE